MLQSSASAALACCSLVLEPVPERMRLQRVVTNVPRRTVRSFALAELKRGDLLIIIRDLRGIWFATSSSGAEPRDCKASTTAWIVVCSCASGPAVNADWAASPGVSAEGRGVSLNSGGTSEICNVKPLSNSRDRASGKSPPSSTRKERRRDITAAKEIK